MDAQQLIGIAIQASMILIVAAVGLQARFQDLFYVLSRPALLLKGVLAVNIIFPIAAILVLMLLPINPVVKLGLALMAISPMAPFLPGKLLKGGVDESYAVGLYAALVLLSVIFVPISATIFSRIFPADITVPVSAIANLAFTSILLPLVVGMAIGTLWPRVSQKLSRIVTIVSFAVLGVIILLVLWRTGNQMLHLMGDGTLLAIALAVAIGLGAGHLLGGPVPAHRIALAQATVTRHPGIAGLIAHRHFDDPRIMLAVLLYLLASIIFTSIYLKWISRRHKTSAGE